MENLSLAISRLESKEPKAVENVGGSTYDFKLAAGRIRTLEPQNCLSCGEPELTEINNPDGLKGFHMKTMIQTGSPSRADA